MRYFRHMLGFAVIVVFGIVSARVAQAQEPTANGIAYPTGW